MSTILADKPSDIVLTPCPVLGDISAGALQVRIAENEEEVRAAQALRYAVFVEEKGAGVSAAMHAAKRDWDEYDPFCDHLLVLDYRRGAPQVVGTYRLLRREGRAKAGSFYSASEFDITRMEEFPGEVMELGRSCVHIDFRNRAVMQLLWRGIGAYVSRHQVGVMFGCASFTGHDPQAHAEALSYLHHYHLAPPHLRIEALPERFTSMEMLAPDQFNPKRAFVALPALIKGYLRLGGCVGHGAVIDAEYNTVDVGIIVQTALVTDKYTQRYGTDG